VSSLTRSHRHTSVLVIKRTREKLPAVDYVISSHPLPSAPSLPPPSTASASIDMSASQMATSVAASSEGATFPHGCATGGGIGSERTDAGAHAGTHQAAGGHGAAGASREGPPPAGTSRSFGDGSLRRLSRAGEALACGRRELCGVDSPQDLPAAPRVQPLERGAVPAAGGLARRCGRASLSGRRREAPHLQ